MLARDTGRPATSTARAMILPLALGRKTCFVAGLIIYGIGGLLALASQGVALLTIGYSLFEGVGSALMIPPIYILITLLFPDVKSRGLNTSGR